MDNFKELLPEYLTRHKGINIAKEFRCLNPMHPDNRPSMRYDRERNKCHCFSCGVDYDLIDLIRAEYGLDFKAAKEKVKELFHMGDYLSECKGRISETNYPRTRGLSEETVKRFNLGYDPEYRQGTGGQIWKALIIPVGNGKFIARNTDPNADAKDRYRKVGETEIFNLQALNRGVSPVYIVEGEIDALSIEEAGGAALALGSAANVKKLVSILEGRTDLPTLAIALDNDQAGQDAAKKLANAFDELNILYGVTDVSMGYKDPNEALIENAYAFRHNIAKGFKVIENESAFYALPDFTEGINKRKSLTAIRTGFSNLDDFLDGGLYAGLYAIGAISSLGKTTFCLQMADNIATIGHDVIIFSLEMARDEIIAKSISRLTHEKEQLTTRNILSGMTEYSQMGRAVEEYSEYAKNIYIQEGVGDVTIERIRQRVEAHVKLTGRSPVVFIDYLQIIAPADPRATDKQNTDKAVIELKRLSRDFKIPVVAISSFNRENYTEPVSMKAFKESGAIEYSADCLIGLQYYFMRLEAHESPAARAERIAEKMKAAEDKFARGEGEAVEVRVLKNRNGRKGSLFLSIFPKYNAFKNCVFVTDYEEIEKYQKTNREQIREKLRGHLEAAKEKTLHGVADVMDAPTRAVKAAFLEYFDIELKRGEIITLPEEEKEEEEFNTRG